MTKKSSVFAGLCFVALMLAFSATLGMSMGPKGAQAAEKSSDVYVCACMKTSSCPCANMSNKAGKCPCGDEMKAVPRNGKWANANRKSLASGK